MNDRKLKELFEAARRLPPPTAPENFDTRVMSSIRREGRAAPVSLWEQLGQLFPRLATAAVVFIAACCLADMAHAALYPASSTSEMQQASDQWLFSAAADNSGGGNNHE
jgi:hypothetical protein